MVSFPNPFGSKPAQPTELTPVTDVRVLSKEEQIEDTMQKIFGGETGKLNCPSTGAKILRVLTLGISYLIEAKLAERKDKAAGVNTNQEGVKELLEAVETAVKVINKRSSLRTEVPANYMFSTVARDNKKINADLELHNQAPETIAKVATLASARLEKTLGLAVPSDVVEAAVKKKISEVRVSNKDGFAARLNTEFAKFSALFHNMTIGRFASKKLEELTPGTVRDLLVSIQRSRGFSDVQMAGVAHQLREALQKAHTPEQFNALIAKYNNEVTLVLTPEFKTFKAALQAERTKVLADLVATEKKLNGNQFNGLLDTTFKAKQKADLELNEARVKVFTHVVGLSGLHGANDAAVADATTFSGSAQADHAAFKAKLAAKVKADQEFQSALDQSGQINNGSLFFAHANASEERVHDAAIWHFRQKKDVLEALAVKVDSNDLHTMGLAYANLRNFVNFVTQ